MKRNRSGLILGYHGCEEKIADAIIAGATMQPSSKEYDWLGPGAYFWENDCDRAMEWAQSKVARGSYTKPAVLGAIIDPGNCLDLTIRSHLELLADSHASLQKVFKIAGKPMPINRDLSSTATAEKPLRYLDCAVITHLHDNIDTDATERRSRGEQPIVEPFDTVRGLFLEGERVYEGGGFYTHTHTQIAVRTLSSILGFFRPR